MRSDVIVPGLWQLYVMTEQRKSVATWNSVAISTVSLRPDISPLITSAFSVVGYYLDSQAPSAQELGPIEFLFLSGLALHLHLVKTEPEATENLNYALFLHLGPL